MIYKSDNGYTGFMEKEIYLGHEHYDLMIYDIDNNMVFHASYAEPLTPEELADEVDSFPDFFKILQSM
jgi:hypothetical protein